MDVNYELLKCKLELVDKKSNEFKVFKIESNISIRVKIN